MYLLALDGLYALKTTGLVWKISGPNVAMVSGSMRAKDRPPLLAHIEVEAPRRGTGERVFLLWIRALHEHGEAEFLTTSQTIEGKAFFEAMQRKGYVERLSDYPDSIGLLRPRYRIIATCLFPH